MDLRIEIMKENIFVFYCEYTGTCMLYARAFTERWSLLRYEWSQVKASVLAHVLRKLMCVVPQKDLQEGDRWHSQPVPALPFPSSLWRYWLSLQPGAMRLGFPL